MASVLKLLISVSTTASKVGIAGDGKTVVKGGGQREAEEEGEGFLCARAAGTCPLSSLSAASLSRLRRDDELAPLWLVVAVEDDDGPTSPAESGGIATAIAVESVVVVDRSC